MNKKLFLVLFFVLLSISALFYISANLRGNVLDTSASFTQDNNNGYFLIDFLDDQSGIMPEAPGLRENIEVDVQTGVASLEDGQMEGYFLTVPIAPLSFSQWEEVQIKGSYSNTNDLLVSLYDCSEPTPQPIVGYQNMSLSGGVVNISSVNKEIHSCLSLRLDLVNSVGIAPVVDDIKVTWNKLPVFLVTQSSTSTVLAGDNITYIVNYSVSYVDDNNVVIWSPIPTVSNGGIINFTPSFGQDLEVSFISASDEGQYTEMEKITYGVTVPSKSVYWVLSRVESGKTGLLTYTLKTKNGTEDGVLYSSRAYMDSGLGELVEGNISTSEIESLAYPRIVKEVIGTLNVGGRQYIYDGSGYTPVVTYNVRVENAYNPYRSRGVEEIFNPVVTDDLSEIVTALTDSCGVMESEVGERITVYNGGVLDLVAPDITWTLSSGIGPNEFQSFSYSVDFTSCPDGLKIGNVSSLEGYNITTVESNNEVSTGLDLTPYGTFAKGDMVNGINEINASRDDNRSRTQTYGETVTYLLLAQNRGFLTLNDVVMMDKVPEGTTFQSASIPTAVKGTIYYSTSANIESNPPVFDYTDPEGSGIWTTTSPANKSDVRWVVAYIPCLSGNYFSSPEGSVCYGVSTSTTVQLQVKIDEPSNVCSQYDISNNARFWTYNRAEDIENDSDIVPLATPMYVYETTEKTHVVPTLAEFSTNSSMTGPSVLKPLENGSYTITIRNTGKDISRNTIVEINIPQINVNGVNQYLDITSVIGGGAEVDFSGLPSTIYVSLGDIPVGQSRTVTLTTRILLGVRNASSFTLSARIVGQDDNACREITAIVSQTTSLVSQPSLKVYTERDVSIIAPKGLINYMYTSINQGDGVSTGTYTVVKVPARTVFEKAYTDGYDLRGQAYECPGCEVYFARYNENLPVNISPLDTLTVTDVNQYFTLGTEIAPGEWISSFGIETYYVAFAVDNSTLANPLFESGGIVKTGMSVINDHNGSDPGDEGSPVGTVIYNYAGIVSNELIQAIGNQVNTTILPDPGLKMVKSSDKEIVYAGEEFEWYVDYYNDSGNDNDEVIITDILPYGTQLLGVYHTWNNLAVTNGAISGEQRLDNVPGSVLVITYNPDGTTTIEIKIAPELRGEQLHYLEGGRLRLKVKVGSSVLSYSVLNNNALVGCFSNASNSMCINASDIVTVENPDLYVRKLASRSDPLSGETISYTIIVSNEGRHEDWGVTLTDTLPEGLCYVVDSTSVTTTGYSIEEPEITGDCLSGGQTLVWDSFKQGSNPVGYLSGSSEDIYITYRVTVDSNVVPDTTLLNNMVIEGDLIEDPYYPNEAIAEVRTPLPDPYIYKSGPLSVLPGDTFSYTIQYGNASRESAPTVYFVDVLPKVNGEVVNFVSIATSLKDELVYYHDETTDDIVPFFDPSDPLSNDWTQDPYSIEVEYIAILTGSLGGYEGPYSILVTVQSAYTNGLEIPAGNGMTNTVTIYTTTEEESLENNYSEAETRTPGIDLAIEKEGSVEGSYPGLSPGDDLSYEITFSNAGTVKACGVYIEDTLPEEFEVSEIVSDFTVLELTNQSGDRVYPIRVGVGNDEIKEKVSITRTQTGDNTYRWELGSSDTIPYLEVCLPPQSTGSFTIYGKAKANVEDSTQITNIVQIGTDSGSIDDILTNNEDSSSVYIYRADVLINKTGYSCGEDGVCGNGDDNPTEVNAGETIEYVLEYDNAGNIDAENVVMQDKIPEGTCYQIDSVELSQPDGAIVEYSNDDGITWNYSPDGSDNEGGGVVAEGFDIGTGVSGSPVYSIGVQSDGKVVLAGSFSTYNGTSVGNIVRLNTDGIRDNSFNMGTGFNGYVRAIAIDANDRILAVGQFTAYNGTAINRIARLNYDGTLDTTFTVGIGFNNTAYTVAIDNSGNIIVGGAFTTYQGTARNRIVKLTPNGSLDSNFSIGSGFSSTVQIITIQPDNRILVGGWFTSYNGASKNRIARLNSTGLLDTSFNVGTGFNNDVAAIVVQDDGKILAGGSFTSYNGTSTSRFARLNTDGSLDSSLVIGTGFNSLVMDILILNDDSILVTGDFSTYNGTAAGRVVVIDSSGNIDDSYDFGVGFNSMVLATYRFRDRLYIGGYFSMYDNDIYNRIIALNINNSDCFVTDFRVIFDYPLASGREQESQYITRSGDIITSDSLTFKPSGVSIVRDNYYKTDFEALQGCSLSAISENPADANNIFVACYSRIFRTDDGGNNWYEVTNNFPILDQYVYDMQVLPGASPGDPPIILVSGYSKLARSADGGATWQLIPVTFYFGFDFDYKPDEPNVVLFATFGRMLRSTDSGATWTQVATASFRAVSFNKTNPNNVIAVNEGSANRVKWSTDGGITWTNSSETGLPTTTGLAAAYDPVDVNTAYIGIYQSGYWRTTDHGATWTRVLSTSSPFRIQTDVSLGGVVYCAASSRLYRSMNYGASWSSDSTYLFSAPYNKYIIEPSYSVTGKVYAPARTPVDTPVRLSEDYAATFIYKNNGLNSLGFSLLIVSNQDANILYGVVSGHSTILKSTDGGDTFTDLMSTPTTSNLTVDPSNHNNLFVASSTLGLSASTDGGETWTQRNNGLPSLAVSYPRIMLSESSVMYVIVSGYGVYKSTDYGNNWTQTAVTYPFTLTSFGGLAIDPNNEDIIFVSNYTAGLYRSVDSGATWTNVSTTQYITGIWINPFDSSRVFAHEIINGNFLTSTNGGISFSSTNIGNRCKITFDLNNPGIIYRVSGSTSTSGTSYIRLYKSEDWGGSWVLQSPQFTNFGMVEALLSEAEDGLVYVYDMYYGLAKNGYRESGYFITNAISFEDDEGNLIFWDRAIFDFDTPEGTQISVSILDSDYNVIPGFDNMVVEPNVEYNISAINVAEYPEIAFRVYFDSDEIRNTPLFRYWAVQFVTDVNPRIEFEVIVAQDTVSELITNTAHIFTSTPEAIYTNNTSSYVMSLLFADLEIYKDVNLSAINADDINAGEELVYTLSYRNNGPDPARNAEITDFIPNADWLLTGDITVNVTGNSVPMVCTPSLLSDPPPAYTYEGIYCDDDGNINTPSNLTLPVGEEGTIEVRVTYSNTPSFVLDDILINFVRIASTTLDPDLSNNSDTASTIVGDYANVWVEKTGPLYTNLGREFSYTVEYGNNGNLDAEDIEIVDTLPDEVDFVSVTQISGNVPLDCGLVGSRVLCFTQGDVPLPAGEVGSIQIIVRTINDEQLIINNTIIHNLVEIETTTPETNIMDDSDTADTRVVMRDLSSITGRVFYDSDEDVIYVPETEFGLEGIEIMLSGYDVYGNIYGPSTEFVFYEDVVNELIVQLIVAGIVPPGMTVDELMSLSNYRIVDPSFTDFAGEYSFTGLNPGTYNVHEIQPFNYYSTGSNGGFIGYDTNGDPIYNTSRDGIGSIESGEFEDANIIRRIILGDGEGSIENNFGEKGGLIGDLVFFDGDSNGVYDSIDGDRPLMGIEVTLFADINQNGILDNGDKPIRSTATNEHGLYYFTDLEIDDPGGDHDFDYMVSVTDQRDIIVNAINTRGLYGVNDNSQDALGYWTAVDAENPINLTADFGFYHASMEIPEEDEDDLIRTGGAIFVPFSLAFIYLIILFITGKYGKKEE